MTDENRLLQKIRDLEQELHALRVENETLTDRAEDVLLLGIVSERISQVKDQNDVVSLTLESISSLKDIHYAAYTQILDNKLKIIEEYAPLLADSRKGMIYGLEEGIVTALHNKEFMFDCNEFASHPSFIPPAVQNNSPNAFCLIPELCHNCPSNMYLFVNYLQDSDYLQTILPLLCRVVELASAKIESLTLLQDITELNSALERKVQERTSSLAAEIAEHKETQKLLRQKLSFNQALADVSKEVISVRNLTSISALVLQGAKTMTDSEHGFVGVIDPKTNNLVSHTLTEMMQDGSCKLEGPCRTITFPPLADGTYPALWGHSLNTKEAFFDNNPKSHPATKGIPHGHIPIVRFMSTPVIINNELVGQIALANKEADYTVDDLQHLERLADLYALAINRQRIEKDHELLMAELRQAQKMEAIGTLAGGIAHDFNNILMAMLGYIELAKLEVEPGGKVDEKLDQVYAAGNRAAQLVRQILAFSRQAESEFKPIQVHLIAKEVIKLLRSSIPTTIEIHEEIPAECGFVNTDPTQIHQIFMNLCTNAYHAMRETGGVLGVKISEITILPQDFVEDPTLTPGCYMKIEISDTGCGIDEDTKNRIFEPYFTTKKKGEGTGLGLAVVHGIVKNHKGHITVYSEKGIGTTFHLYLPLLPEGGKDILTANNDEILGGNERIFFIDDEEPIAKLGKLLLEGLGYSVTTFTDSQEAFRFFAEKPMACDLVITDMTMPVMTGMELMIKMRTIRTNIPVILCTGFSDIVNKEKAKAMGINAYVTKPITRAGISQIIRQVLDES